MNTQSILLICPSRVIAGGLEKVLCEHGEFRIGMVLTEMPRSVDVLHGADFALTIIDPVVLDFGSRQSAKNILGDMTGTPVMVLQTVFMDEDMARTFDGVVNLYDMPSAIVQKCRKAMEADLDTSRSDGGELSAREKEILVSVAKGKLNKEIADEFNISVYTVMTHRKNITRKTGIKTVAGLTVYAVLNNLLDPTAME